jgi:hypothetical protein
MNGLAVRLAIGSPKLQRIFLHWLVSRTDRLMPRWQDMLLGNRQMLLLHHRLR